jgi:PAS domain S-box-containing protein
MLRILHLEDDPVDVELVQAMLAADGLETAVTAVSKRQSFERALANGFFDVILADHRLPNFDGLQALAMAREIAPQTPFIFVTGVLLEEQAIEALRNGATDYVYKNRIKRLAPAVRRAVREAAERAERLEAQATAQAEREWLRVTLSSIGDAVIATDMDGRVTFLNPVAETLTGWTQAEAVGLRVDDVFQIVGEHTGQPLESPVHRALRERVIVGLSDETLLVNRHARTRPIDDSAAPIRDSQGQLIGAVLVFRDVTEQRRAEAALRDSESRFRLLTDSAPVMVWMSDAKGNNTFVNQRWLNFTGQSPEEAMGWGWAECVHPDDRERCMAEFQAALRSHQPYETEYRVCRAGGDYRWVVDRGVPRLSAEGEFLGFIGSIVDIHERRTSEDALRSLTVRLDRALAEAELVNAIASAASGEADLDRMLSVALEHLSLVVSLTGGSIALLEDQALVIQAARGPFAEEARGQRLRRADWAGWQVIDAGQPFWTNDLHALQMMPPTLVRSYLAVPLRWQGRIFGLLEVDSIEPDAFSPHDLNLVQRVATVLSGSIQLARLHAELEQRVLERTAELLAANAELHKEIEERQRSEARFRRLVESAPDAIVMADAAGRIVLANTQASQLFGYAPEDLIGQPMEMLMPERVRQRHELHRAGFQRDPRARQMGTGLDLYARHKDGREFPVEISLSPMQSADGLLVLSAIRDVSQRKAIELELRRLSEHLQAAREQEATRIAREIHDELGGAMTSLKMEVARLKRLAPGLQPETLEQSLEAISSLIDSTIKTVRRIATDLRPGVLDDLGLVPAIEWQLQDFQARSGIECRLNCDVEDVALEGDRATAVFRVFQETLTNVARHAQATRVDVDLHCRNGCLELQVKDNGRGISERQRRATGSLGLLGMRERVRLLQGELAIDGQPGQGTVVRLKVPLQPANQDPHL